MVYLRWHSKYLTTLKEWESPIWKDAEPLGSKVLEAFCWAWHWPGIHAGFGKSSRSQENNQDHWVEGLALGRLGAVAIYKLYGNISLKCFSLSLLFPPSLLPCLLSSPPTFWVLGTSHLSRKGQRICKRNGHCMQFKMCIAANNRRLYSSGLNGRVFSCHDKTG